MPKTIAVQILRIASVACLARIRLHNSPRPSRKKQKLMKAELDEFWVDENGWTQLHWAAAANDGATADRLRTPRHHGQQWVPNSATRDNDSNCSEKKKI